MAHVLSFTGYNLANALYRNHTSFIKDLTPEMGRSFRVSYSLRFFWFQGHRRKIPRR